MFAKAELRLPTIAAIAAVEKACAEPYNLLERLASRLGALAENAETPRRVDAVLACHLTDLASRVARPARLRAYPSSTAGTAPT